jgi:hypothetical protein
MWAAVRDGLEWSYYPQSVQDFSENFCTKHGKKGMGVMWFLFGLSVGICGSIEMILSLTIC